MAAAGRLFGSDGHRGDRCWGRWGGARGSHYRWRGNGGRSGSVGYRAARRGEHRDGGRCAHAGPHALYRPFQQIDAVLFVIELQRHAGRLDGQYFHLLNCFTRLHSAQLAVQRKQCFGACHIDEAHQAEWGAEFLLRSHRGRRGCRGRRGIRDLFWLRLGRRRRRFGRSEHVDVFGKRWNEFRRAFRLELREARGLAPVRRRWPRPGPGGDWPGERAASPSWPAHPVRNIRLPKSPEPAQPRSMFLLTCSLTPHQADGWRLRQSSRLRYAAFHNKYRSPWPCELRSDKVFDSQ